MASVVDICNGALGHVANAAEVTSIDPPDGTPEADHCARYYSIARDECLAKYTWSFATARKFLAEMTGNEMEGVWGFAYAPPNKLLRPISVLLPGSPSDSESRSYLMETMANGGGVIYTNVEGAVLKYVYQQEDSSKFTPMFTVALMTNLASYLAGPIAKDIKLKQGLKAQALAELAQAAVLDHAQKIDYYKYYTPAHLAVRA